MPRRDATHSQSHGLNDVIGVVLVFGGLLLVVALLSYDNTTLRPTMSRPTAPP